MARYEYTPDHPEREDRPRFAPDRERRPMAMRLPSDFRRPDPGPYDRGRPGPRDVEGQRGRPGFLRALDVMSDEIATVRPDTPVDWAARLMRDYDCGALPVTDERGRAIGMVTDRDIVCRILAEGRDVGRSTVRDCMTADVFTCDAEAPVEDCMRTMARHQVRRIPILDRRSRVIGIVSQGDLALEAAKRPGHGRSREVAEVVGAVSEPTDDPYR